MLSAELFDILSLVGARIRGNNLPFGGIQLVLCGDFFQLPPVGLGNNSSNFNSNKKPVHFCFESETWQQVFGSFQVKQQTESGRMIVLDKIFRQRDEVFLKILSEVRLSQISANSQSILNRKVAESYRPIPITIDQVKHTKLYATNKDVDNYNINELTKLPSEPTNLDMSEDGTYPDLMCTYHAIDNGDEVHLKQLRQGIKAPEDLELRIGAQVMLVKNLDTGRGLVNGARGVVVKFVDSDGQSSNFPILPVIKFELTVGGHKSTAEVTIVDAKFDITVNDK